MLYRFNNNLINIAEISTVCSTKGSNSQYPFDLTVNMKDGRSIRVCYRTEEGRNTELWNIEQAYKAAVSKPITYYEVETLIRNHTDKIRRDLRQLKTLLREGVELG